MSGLLGAAAPAFDDPLALLAACHERILTQCHTLERLLQHLQQHGCDIQARQAAQALLRYFDTAGRHHHDDEEQDLFPALRASGDDTALPLIERLLLEHQGLDAAWRTLRIQLVKLTATRSAMLDEATVQHFIAAYRNHIAMENGQLLPLAAILLDATQLHGLGRRMAARRGVALVAPAQRGRQPAALR